MNISGTMNELIKALYDGDQVQAVAMAKELRKEGVPSEQIVREGIEEAMGRLDAKCTVEQFNLLEIMLAGRAVTAVIKDLYPSGARPAQMKGPVVLASLEGDGHDLGKNILKMVLTGKGFRVVDCGKDCPVDKLLDAAEKEEALAIGISGLITTIIPAVRQVKDMAVERGLGHIKVFAGGAALKQASAKSLNVDFVADSAFDGAHFLEETLKEQEDE